MKSPRFLLLPALFFAATLPIRAADQPTPSPTPAGRPPEEQIVLDTANDYTLAYNLNHAAKVAALYAADVQYEDASGALLQGREALQSRLTAFFQQHPGATIDLGVDAARLLTPEVIAERGRTTVTLPGGATTGTTFTATLVQKDGGWLISQVTEKNVPVTVPAEQKLAALAWLIGDWQEESGGNQIKTKVESAQGGKFLSRTYTVTDQAGVKFQGTEIIGWDARAGKIRSWFFDSEGGFGEGIWSHEGNSWLVKTTSTLPDGRAGSAVHTYTRQDEHRLLWSSASRTLGGELLPAIQPVEITRVK